MKVLVEPSHALPLVDVEFLIPRGASGDPSGKEGLTHITARLMRRGPKGLSANRFDEQLDRLGATLGVSVSQENVRLGGTVLARNLSAYLQLLGRVLREPALRSADFGRLRRRTEAELVALRDHDRALAGRAFRRLLFGAHPYGRPVGGTLGSVATIRRADVVARHSELARAGQLIVGAAGAVEADVLRPTLSRALEGLPEGTSDRPRARSARRGRGRRIVIVDKPQRTQTQLFVGTLGTRAGSPDLHALWVGNTGFGGTFTSRLVKEVRSERGWSYGVGSKVGADRQREAWTMWSHPGAEQLVDCLALELELLDRWVAEGLSADELRRAKRYLIKSHPFDLETAAKRLEPRLEAAAYRLPPRWHASYLERIRGVTRTDATKAVQRTIDPSSLAIAMVATATPDLRRRLEALPQVREVTVIPPHAV